MTEIAGACHCGDVSLRYRTAASPERLARRTCDCAYCTRQGAQYVSDPNGDVAFQLAETATLICYRFATATADFVSCGRCGTYVAAVSRIDGRDYAVINANILDAPPSAPEARSFEGETSQNRLGRRARTWTPVTGGLPASAY